MPAVRKTPAPKPANVSPKRTRRGVVGNVDRAGDENDSTAPGKGQTTRMCRACKVPLKGHKNACPVMAPALLEDLD
jgi:hypothetical protein